MQATTTGPNLTGGAVSPADLQAMIEAAEEITPAGPIDTSLVDEQRLLYISEAEAVGSIPPPASLKGVVKTGLAKLKGGQPAVLLDKLGERLAYERTGTRLYEALILKYRGACELDPDALPPAASANGNAAEAPGDTLERIRAEELAHFHMLCEAVEQLGGDPTSQTPCADVSAVASMGLMQVLTDPRTTLAQSLNAMLTVELTDNAGWELLISLAEDAGESELSGRFLGALAQEQEHLAAIKSWLTALVADETSPQVV